MMYNNYMLEKIHNNVISNVEIFKRDKESSKSRYTEHFIYKINGKDLGFISIDKNENVDYLVLYEIFIPISLRGCGYGTKLLGEVEILAKKLGYKRIVLFPEPFEKNISKILLIEWYQKNGYNLMSAETGELEKKLSLF